MAKAWRDTCVEDVCERVSVGIVIQPSQYYTTSDVGVRAFRSANVGENRILDRDWVFLTPEGHAANSKSILQTGDVLVVRSGAPGLSCVVTPDFAGSNCIDIVFARPRQTRVLPEYLAVYTNSELGRKQVLGRQGGLALKHLNVSAYKQMRLNLPALGEQRKITHILQTWDEAIQRTEQLLDLKRTAATALALQFIRGHRHVSLGRSEWPHVSLADVTNPLSTRNSGQYGEDRVMAVTKLHGLIPMREHVRAEDISRYKIVPPNAFAYNPMRLNIGSLAKNEYGNEVLVSPDYVVFAAKSEVLDHRFLDHLRRTSIWSKFVETAGNGSVRVRIYYPDLARMTFRLPPLQEQKAIAEILDTARHEVTLLERQKAALEGQKRGLMQKLLTGEWRVKVD